MRRSTIAAIIITTVLVLATLVTLLDSDLFRSNDLKFAFLPENEIEKITNNSYNYTSNGETAYRGEIISEYRSFTPGNPQTSNLFLEFLINKYNSSAQAMQKYQNYTSITMYNPDKHIYSAVNNASYSGFTYSYIWPLNGGNYFYQSLVYGVDQNFLIIIQLNIHISNTSLVQLIQSQMAVMQ